MDTVDNYMETPTNNIGNEFGYSDNRKFYNTNIVILTGNLCHDLELKKIENKYSNDSPTDAIRFTLAVHCGVAPNKEERDELSKQEPKLGAQDTMFISCSAFGMLAYNIYSCVHKGDRMIVYGTLQQYKYKDSNNNNEIRSSFSVKVTDASFSLKYKKSNYNKNTNEDYNRF